MNKLFIGILTAVSLSLSACNSILDDRVQTTRTTIDVPEEYFTCETPITRPSGDNIMESEVARYINSLEFSQKDCETRLKELRVLIRCANDPECNVDVVRDLIAIYRDENQR